MGATIGYFGARIPLLRRYEGDNQGNKSRKESMVYIGISLIHIRHEAKSKSIQFSQ